MIKTPKKSLILSTLTETWRLYEIALYGHDHGHREVIIGSDVGQKMGDIAIKQSDGFVYWMKGDKIFVSGNDLFKRYGQLYQVTAENVGRFSVVGAAYNSASTGMRIEREHDSHYPFLLRDHLKAELKKDQAIVFKLKHEKNEPSEWKTPAEQAKDRAKMIAQYEQRARVLQSIVGK